MSQRGRGWRVVGSGFGLAVAGLLVAHGGCADGQQWTSEVVDTGGGWDLSAVLDYRSTLHVAYFREAGNTGYASAASGAGFEVGPTFRGIGQSLALDRGGHAGLSLPHPSGSSSELDVYRLDSWGVWQSTIGVTGTLASASSVAFDRLNRPHLAFVDTAAKALRYHRPDDAYGTTLTVATGATFGAADASITVAVDAHDRAYFAWYDAASSAVKFATPNAAGTAWTVSQLGEANAPGVAMAFDDSGAMHVAYRQNYLDLYYATLTGTTWSAPQLVDRNVVAAPGLALDGRGRPNLAYVVDTFNGQNSAMYAAPQGGGGSSWATQTVGTWTDTVSGPEAAAIAVDRRGRVNVVYADDQRRIVRAASGGSTGAVAGRKIFPVFDAAATGDLVPGRFTLTDGGLVLKQVHNSSNTQDLRTVMEFPLDQVADGATVLSARLLLYVTDYATDGTRASALDVYGYVGDGRADSADAAATDRIIGALTSINAMGGVTIDLDPAFIEAVRSAGSKSYLGLVVTASLATYDSAFVSSEGGPGLSTSPALSVTYQVPEPGGVWCVGLVAGRLLARRRRRG